MTPIVLVPGLEPGPLAECLLAAFPDGILLVADDGTVAGTNLPMAELLGCPATNLLGRPLAEVLPADGPDPTAPDLGARPDPGESPTVARNDRSQHPRLDTTWSPIEVAGRAYAVGFVRDASDRRWREVQVRASAELMAALLAGDATETTLALVSASAGGLTGADAAWIVAPDPTAATLEVVAASGRARPLLGMQVQAAGSRTEGAMARHEPLVLDLQSDPLRGDPEVRALVDCGIRHVIACPMLAEHPVGMIAVGWTDAPPTALAQAIEGLQGFADLAGVALELARARADLEQLHILEDRDRIARDLHDTVVQRVYGVAVRLAAIENDTTGAVRENLVIAVDLLDEINRDLRAAIFDLGAPGGNGGLLAKIRRLAHESAGPLGFEPRVRAPADLDAVVTPELAIQVAAVVREALSNVARHAAASSAEVTIRCRDGVLEVEVDDDGVGPGRAGGTGLGTSNLLRRASRLGGSFHVSERSPSGTHLSWRVPLAPD